MSGAWSACRAVLRRDLLVVVRHPAEVVNSLFFFVMVVSLFPLGVGPDPQTLHRIGPGVLWVAALLSSMLGLQRLFAADYHDGTLEQMALAANPLGLLTLAKIVAHWLTSGLPLVLLSPLLGLQYGLSGDALWVLAASLLLGTPLLSLLGAVGAALTLGVRGGGVLLSLLVLPLYIPALIMGAGAVEAELAGLAAAGHLALLGAMLVVAVFFLPMATTAALRLALE